METKCKKHYLETTLSFVIKKISESTKRNQVLFLRSWKENLKWKLKKIALIAGVVFV